MSELAYVLARATDLFANSLIVLILARVVLSWIYPNVRNTLVFWVWRLSESFLQPIRKILPHSGRIDLSPWVALVLIFLARTLIIEFLYTWL
jgi:YggT family protein